MEETKLDAQEMIRLAEQMVHMLEERNSSGFLNEIHADLFHISLSCADDHAELYTLLEDLQNQIRAFEDALKEAHGVDHSNTSEADIIQKRKDELLHRESTLKLQERSMQNMLENLIRPRQGLQSEKEMLKKLETDMQRNQMVLALCASTFHMIPSDGGENVAAGSLVNSEGSVINTFGFNTENMDAFDVCEKLWGFCSAFSPIHEQYDAD